MSVSNMPASGFIDQVEPTRAVAVYRLFGVDDLLLYVGISSSPTIRWAQHKADKPWWSEVRSYKLEWLPSREFALRYEVEAIRTEGPKYNVVGTDRHRERILAAQRNGASEESGAARELAVVIDALAAIENDEECVRALSGLLNDWPGIHTRLREIRQGRVQALKAQGMTWSQIAEVIGQVTPARAQQIGKGLSGASRAKSKRAAEEAQRAE